MKPLKVEFQAFGPYGGYESVDFERLSGQGLFLICGKTGVGKTTILDAMTFALFGKSSGSGRDDFASMRCTKASFDITTFVRFEFENNGEYYQFERRLERKRKNLKASYNAAKKDENDIWQPLFENAKEKNLNDKAVDIIGLDYSQFVQVIVLPQGKFEKFLTSNSDDKERILTSIFGEDRWQEIANLMYEEAFANREQVKGVCEQIANSLRDEGCEKIGELVDIIEQKSENLTQLEENYSKAFVEEQIKRRLEEKAVVARFTDLDKAREKVAVLEAGARERQEWGNREALINRALKVKPCLQAVSDARTAHQHRTLQLEEIKQQAEDAKTKARASAESYKTFLSQESKIEEEKLYIHSLEGKKDDYEGLGRIKKELDSWTTRKKQSENRRIDAKAALDELIAQITGTRDSYEKLSGHHKALLDAYLEGITGVLAGSLKPNEPCPVCGSTNHPNKACVQENDVTKEQVDSADVEKNDCYKKLQDMMNSQAEAQKSYENILKELENDKSQVTALEAKLAASQSNMVSGITNLKELEEAIKNAEDRVNTFLRKKSEMELKDKELQTMATQLLAQVDPAAREVAKAVETVAVVTKELEKALEENDFESIEAVEEILTEESLLASYQKKMQEYDAEVLSANISVKELSQELENTERPDSEAVQAELDRLDADKTSYIREKTSLEQEIKRLIAKKTNIDSLGEGIEEKIRQADDDFIFAKNLRGDTGTGLQRYVLGIMFSSVVTAANKMLELVHGGRYRLFRSDEKAAGTSKRGLELKVYDNLSGEHEGRFVNTLSGGEKFLASLALSIGMSTVAQRSGIRIEALFIDEGFGSLDEDSIGDAMNILASIQKANGMVGIISHVQLLQDRIPTKLQVTDSAQGSHIVQTVG